MKTPQRNVNLAAVLNKAAIEHLLAARDLLASTDNSAAVSLIETTALDCITAARNFRLKSIVLSKKGQRG